MKIFITGGTGFLGLHLVPRLIEAGHQLVLIARTPKPDAFEGLAGIEYFQADLSERDVVRRALIGAEAVFHLAGLVSFNPKDGHRMYALHVDRTRELLADIAALGTKPRVILASTSGTIAVFKDERVGNEALDYPIATVGRWPYYMSKIFEEKLALDVCRKNGIPLVVLNPSLLMGPGDERLSSTWTIVKFLQREIPSLPGGGMSCVDVRDVAQAAVNALTQGEIYGRHLMGVNLSMKEFFERLERLSGIPAPKLRLPKEVTLFGAHVLERWQKWRGADAALHPQEVEIGEHWFWVDASKAERLLGFAPRDVYETLHDTVADTVKRLPNGALKGLRFSA